MINLYVQDQNTAIGHRNIHRLKAGSRLSIGGGKSDYLIFLVPLPQRIGYVNFDGNNCTFTPRLHKYFPDLGNKALPNCLGKSIRIVNDRDYELYIRFERYRNPLKAINDLMNSILLPGENAAEPGKS